MQFFGVGVRKRLQMNMQKALWATYTGVNFIRNALIVVFLLGVTVFNPFLWMGFAFYDSHNSRQAIELDHYREGAYQKICPIYRDASTWDRWFNYQSEISWCADYPDRL